MKRSQPQPAGANILHEQAEFDDFIEKFNHSWFCLLFARLKRRWWRDRTSMIGNVFVDGIACYPIHCSKTVAKASTRHTDF